MWRILTRNNWSVGGYGKLWVLNNCHGEQRYISMLNSLIWILQLIYIT